MWYSLICCLAKFVRLNKFNLPIFGVKRYEKAISVFVYLGVRVWSEGVEKDAYLVYYLIYRTGERNF